MDTYEKKYKEALELARDYYKANLKLYKADENVVLDDIFPELKESEDERIRKALVEMVHDTTGDSLWIDYNVHKEDAIAWLEKQGESSIKWNKNTEGNKPHVNHSVLMKTIHGIAEGEWKGEYWEQYRWAGIVRDSDVLSWMELSDLEKQGEQKPFDYENANIQQKDFAPQEDAPRYSIGDVLCDKSCTTLDKDAQPNYEIVDIRNGLYICDKGYIPISQQDEYELVAKKIEQNLDWSEEDEEELDIAISTLKEAGQHDSAKWLKSLKQRHTWKPTKKQMDALLFVVQHYTPNVTDKLAWDSIKILELMYHEINQ